MDVGFILIFEFMVWIIELNKIKNLVGEIDFGGKMMSFVLDML